MKTTSYTSALIKERCPRCRKGALFMHPVYRLGRFAEMHKNCPCCGLKYEVEPGFFIGAMFISYAFGVAGIVAGFAATYILFDNPELWVYLSIIISVVIVIMPFSFRYSRVLMLYWFGGVKYDPGAAVNG